MATWSRLKGQDIFGQGCGLEVARRRGWLSLEEKHHLLLFSEHLPCSRLGAKCFKYTSSFGPPVAL